MKQHSSQQPILYIVLAFAAIYIVWGSAYVCNKILVSELPPFLIAGSRFVTAGILILILSYFFGVRARPSGRQLANAVIAGFMFLTLGNGLLVYGLQYLDSNFAALLVAAEPLVVLLLLLGLRGQPIGLKSIVGVMLGLVGIYLLVAQDGTVLAVGSWKGLVGVAVSMVAWGYASIFVGDADLPKGHFFNTGVQMIAGGLLLFLLSISTEEYNFQLSDISSRAWLSMAYLIIFASIVAFTAFNYLLKYVSPEKVATSNYVNPIVAMILGWFLLDEVLSVQSGVAAIVLLLGVYFVNSSKSTKK